MKPKRLKVPVTVPYERRYEGWIFVSPPPAEHVATFSCPECGERFKFNVKWNKSLPKVKMIPKKSLSRTVNFEPGYVYTVHGYLEIGGDCPRCKGDVHFVYDDEDKPFADVGAAIDEALYSAKRLEILKLEDGYRITIHGSKHSAWDGPVTGDGSHIPDAIANAIDNLD